VQVDTGSDVLWVNCINCDGCPATSGLGVLPTLLWLSLPPSLFSFFSGHFADGSRRRFLLLMVLVAVSVPVLAVD
jgi:hypothetical protein